VNALLPVAEIVDAVRADSGASAPLARHHLVGLLAEVVRAFLVVLIEVKD
jgi:hypothetical protein